MLLTAARGAAPGGNGHRETGAIHVLCYRNAFPAHLLLFANARRSSPRLCHALEQLHRTHIAGIRYLTSTSMKILHAVHRVGTETRCSLKPRQSSR